MNEIEYHLGELEIARTPDDPRRVLPVLPDRSESILDLGCGIGQTLIACELHPRTFACGVDVDARSLALGKEYSSHIRLVCAEGERLPFRSHSFEVAISRVSLPYMQIPRALEEIARVLKPGGYVWFTLHPFSALRQEVIGAVCSGSLKNLVRQIYALLNGIWFHLTGRQFRFPLNRSRCESFQTMRGMTRAMQKVGFEQVRAERGRFFVVTAVLHRVMVLVAGEFQEALLAIC